MDQLVLFNPSEVSQNLMTTKELAEALNVDVRTIRNTVDSLGEDFRKSISERSCGGRPSMMFNEAQATAIKLELQNHSKVNQLTPKTTLEKQLLIRQAMNLQQEMIDELQAELEQKNKQLLEQAPDVEYAQDLLSDVDHCYRMDVVAQTLNLGYGRNTLFLKLRDLGILKGDNTPYERFSQYFKVLQKPVKMGCEVKTVQVCLVTQEGLKFLNKKLKEA